MAKGLPRKRESHAVSGISTRYEQFVLCKHCGYMTWAKDIRYHWRIKHQEHLKGQNNIFLCLGPPFKPAEPYHALWGHLVLRRILREKKVRALSEVDFKA